jgi:hypothetical protein
MKCGLTIVGPLSHRNRGICGLILLTAILVVFGAPRAVEAKPQINIMLCSVQSGSVPFYLWWSTEGTKNASNYIWTYLYDSNGNVLGGYPVEDPNDYVIPTTQTTQATCPLSAATGSESAQALGAASVVLNCSGDWNGCSAGPEPVSPGGGDQVIKNKVSLKVNKPRTLNVRHWERRLPPGQSNKYTVLFEVRNSTKQQAKMRFVYGVFAKTDFERGHIMPVKQRDTRGNLHMFNTLTHGGAADYTIPANTPFDAPFVVSDLEIDLTKGVKPTDYVYVDVWAIDLTNHEHYPLDRIQVKP